MIKPPYLNAAFASLFLLTVQAQARTISAPKSDMTVFTAEEAAAAEADPNRFRIDPNSVSTEMKAAIYMPSLSYVPETPKSGTVVLIGEIINIALKVWSIIEDNAPTVDIQTKFAAAVPRGIETWTQLTGWRKPVGYLYSVSATNVYGQKCVEIEYKVLYVSGGQYEGKGKYLTGVTVIPTRVKASWGYHISLAAEVPDSTVINMGTTEDPVAAMQLVLATRVHTIVQSNNFTNVYYIDGNGGMEEIAGPFATRELKDIGSAAPLLEGAETVFN